MSASTRQGALSTRQLWFTAAGASVLLLVLLLGLPTASTPVQGAALRVQLDPETGELVPVTGLDKAQLDQQMQMMVNRKSTGLKETRHADGGVSVNLEGRFQSMSVATTDDDGTVRTGCVTNERELKAFMNSDGTAGAQPTEKE